MEQKAAIVVLGALAQETRLEAFRLLVKHEPDGLAAGELARLLAVPQNTLSNHLSIMARQSGLHEAAQPFDHLPREPSSVSPRHAFPS